MRYDVSDIYPDLEAFRRASETAQGRVTYIERPVDALHIPEDQHGLRLLVRFFHHFRPEQAERILREAYDRPIPIVVFEITSRRLLQILLIGPLSVLAMFLLLPKILRAYSWRGALWFLPATFTYTWDGFVSCLRSYTLRELESMTRTLSDRYHWRIGFLPTKIPGTRITYLTGAAQAPGC